MGSGNVERTMSPRKKETTIIVSVTSAKCCLTLGDRLYNGSPYAIGSLSVLSCLSVCLSVTFVHCGQTVGGIKMKLGTQVGLGPGHIVLDGDPAPLLKGAHSQFSAHISCGQTAASIKMSLGMDLGLDLGDFVLDGDPVAPSPKGGGRTPKILGPCLL